MTSPEGETVKRARDRLSQLPPVTLAAQVEELHTEIEHQLARGRRLQGVVDELNAAGIPVSLAVFKSTLYRLRKRKKAQATKAKFPGVPSSSATQGPHVANGASPTRPPRYHPPTEDIFK